VVSIHGRNARQPDTVSGVGASENPARRARRLGASLIGGASGLLGGRFGAVHHARRVGGEVAQGCARLAPAVPAGRLGQRHWLCKALDIDQARDGHDRRGDNGMAPSNHAQISMEQGMMITDVNMAIGAIDRILKMTKDGKSNNRELTIARAELDHWRARLLKAVHKGTP
jgi:hypothetical protein